MQSAQPDGSQSVETYKDAGLPNLSKNAQTRSVGPENSPPTPGNETRFAVSFTGSGGEYFKIWIVNVMLSIITLYIYSAWAKVRNERYFAGNTFVDGSAFEYHATGKQIFLGRVIAVALLAAVVILGMISPFAEIAIAFITVMALPWIIWRSLKFNLRMKSYRNVRFGFYGSLGGAYYNLLILPFVPLILGSIVAGAAYYFLQSTEIAAITMGIAILSTFLIVPLIQQRVARYALSGSQFGQSKIESTPSTTRYYSVYVKALVLSLLIPIAITAIVATILGVLGMQSEEKLTAIVEGFKDQDMAIMAGPIIMVYLAMFLGSFIIKSYISVRIREHLLSQTQLDEKITFESTMRVIPLTGLILSNILLLVITLGLAMPWTKIRLARYEAENTFLHSANGLHDVVAAEHSNQSSLGEEIGEAFDMDVSIGI